MSENKQENEIPPELDWIQLSKNLDTMYKTETVLDRIKRKSNENPFIPFGCLATLAALSYGLWCFQKGDSKKSQLMMRTRILAQGFTIIAFVVGLGVTASKHK
ncbi:hypothetical protein FQA39_LY09941 [Lamprigera yunnana]|nr:hypothetical protein FQA39_LY09941 [Lamprigera yunnana]